ncbi:redox-regulated ATPase YchF [Candidatus Saccharibacteria bacterium]|nr:redox-regulated ATPase YchF [Candidatus Saccharibacteria bacterium]
MDSTSAGDLPNLSARCSGLSIIGKRNLRAALGSLSFGRVGIIGLPNVGKSTLFNALTDADALAANYPFATIEPNTGIVPVPDERLEKLKSLYGSQKVLPATVTFVDIAGLVAGASKGEGLGNKFLANIRECDAVVHVVRAFSDSDVVHVDENHDPQHDIETINTELALADIQTIDKMLPKLQKEAKTKPDAKKEMESLLKAKDLLEKGDLSNLPNIDAQLLSTKPIIYLFNVDEETLADNTKTQNLRDLVAPAQATFVCAKLEEELKSLIPEEAAELLESYGVKEAGLPQLIHAAYDTLGLQSYLTAGPKEIRAWTIKKGSTGPQAAGVIHTDFERGFIAAQVIDYDDLITAGSEAAAKSAGKIRTEGKDYVMQPGDVVEFRFNV